MASSDLQGGEPLGKVVEILVYFSSYLGTIAYRLEARLVSKGWRAP
jgi:hypothetical protein